MPISEAGSGEITAVISQKPSLASSACIAFAETALVSANLPASANATHRSVGRSTFEWAGA